MKELKPQGRGCFTASYPTVAWRKARCVTAPLIPYLPVRHSPPVRGVRHEVRRQTVGNGTDYSAQVSGGPIFEASGTFDTGTTVTSVGRFSLQLNSAPFTSPACSTALVPAVCHGWQQFIYSSTSNVVFMQYWLLNYSTTCPAGWTTFSNDCFTNSPGRTLTGGPLTAANLASAVFNGIATSGNDTVSLSDGGLAAAVSNPDSMLNLSPNWTTVEFTVVGDGGGSQATFGAGTTLAVRTTVDNGGSAAPTCLMEGFTGETNNLDLAPTPSITGGANPAIESIQNSTGGVPSCATIGHGDGDTHLRTFGNLLYDFQAQGDFELASTGPNFLVQNRQVSGAPSWPNAAVNQAIAARVGTSNVAVCAAESTPLHVNGKPRSLARGAHLNLPGGASVSLDSTGTTYLIRDGSGDSVTAAVSSTTSPRYINAAVGLGRWPEPVQGLLANAAGNTNPTAIQARTGKVLTAPYAFSPFYSTYGNSWRVTKPDLLTACGNPPAQSNPANVFYTSNLPPATARAARAICLNDGVKAAPLLAACTVDEAVLGKKAPLVYRTLPTNVTVGQISPPKGSGGIHS